MKSFQFRLDRVLDWYRNQFEIEQAKFAAALAALHAAEQAIARFQAERLNVERDVLSRTVIAAREFQALGLYRIRARKRERDFEDQRLRREAAVRAQSQRLQEAQRRLKLIEKLRERRLAEHRYQEERELETLAAEAYLAKWVGEKPRALPAPEVDRSQP